MSPDSPLVSVIIPCHNAENHLVECLDSVFGQAYGNIEVIACDDASSDATLAILNEYASRHANMTVLRNDTNLFAAASRNRCIEASNGKYIVVQDADDISTPHRVEQSVRALENEPGIDFVSGAMRTFGGRVEKTGVQKKEYPRKEDFLVRLPFYHPSTTFSRRCLDAVGGYRVAPETRRGQDYDLYMRLYAAGYRGKNISDVLCYYRRDAATFQRRTLRYKLDACRIRYKGFKALGLLPKGWIFVIWPIPLHFLTLLKRKFTERPDPS